MLDSPFLRISDTSRWLSSSHTAKVQYLAVIRNIRICNGPYQRLEN